MKYKLKQARKTIKLYASLPHFWMLGIILVLAIIAYIISNLYMQSNPFLSSLFANIFAGLVTGIVISLISTVKSITLYRIECLIEWLELLHKDIKEYIGMHRKMIMKRQHDFDDEEFYNHIYDTLCCGNNVNVTISQGQFNHSLPFDPYKYVKNTFKYDAIYYSKKNEKLREQIIGLNQDVTNNELRDLFKEMDRQLTILNSEIIKHITYLKARRKAINVSLM